MFFRSSGICANPTHILSDSERMVSQAITFFTAGYETTSNLIAFTLYELCIHPDIQTRVRNEMQETIQKHGDITYEAIQDMKYLNMVVSGKKNIGHCISIPL